MRIHVVKPGESVWKVARMYKLPIDELIRLNRLDTPDQLVPGRTLVVPPLQQHKLGEIEVNAYIQPTGTEKQTAMIHDVAPDLTYLSLFGYHVREDATLITLTDEEALAAAKSRGIKPMMVILNLVQGVFSAELANAILTDEALQRKLITNILQVMRDKGYEALNIDFEHIFPRDREAYNRFLERITNDLHKEGYEVSTVLAPKQSATQSGEWYEAHDYAAHGRIVDFVIIMTYEWGWSGGPPMAVAPINQVEKVVKFAVTQIPRGKIMMGMPLYGYDWTLPFVQGGTYAKVVNPEKAYDIAFQYGASIQYDNASQSPFFNYWDEKGKKHVVWFEDARSVLAKFRLAHKYKLRGLSYWVLGHNFPQNWVVLANTFNIAKK